MKKIWNLIRFGKKHFSFLLCNSLQSVFRASTSQLFFAVSRSNDFFRASGNFKCGAVSNLNSIVRIVTCRSFSSRIQNKALLLYSFCSATEIGLPILTFMTRRLTKTSDGNFAVRKVPLILERK
jgi:hypothetical protein